MSTYFSIELPVGEVRKALETHLKVGRLLSAPPGGRISLSPSTRADVEERIGAANNLEETVRREWLLEVAAVYPDLDGEKLWRALQEYLGSVFRKNGALAAELLRPGSTVNADAGSGLVQLLHAALNKHDLSQTAEAAAGVTLFFKGGTPARTRYVSQLLDGTFTFFALTVSDATAEFLRGQLPSTRLFLDTNVVLGMLDLHDNPMQEATQELLSFLKKNKLPFQLYYHERTLKELRELINSAAGRLLASRFSVSLSRAVVQWSESSGRVSGIERRYHALNSQQPLDPKVFLSKFDHIEDLLADKGVKLYRESPPEFDVSTKGSYIAEFEHFLQIKRPGKPRPYAARDHDVVLWMSLQRQRRRASNALKTGAMLLTNDYALFDFDAKVLRSNDLGRVSTVVLPQQLIQVLRPFVGTTADFDTRFLEVFAAPEFRTAQSDYDETASLVVSYLATYEDVSTETAVRVMSDEVLLSRLKPEEQTESEFRELIENAVFQDNTALLTEIEDKKRRMADVEAAGLAQAEAAGAAARAAAEARQAAERLRHERDDAAARAMAAEQAAVARAEELERGLQEERDRRAAAEGALADQAAESGRRLMWMRVAVACMLGLFGVLALAFGPEATGWQGFVRHDKRLPISLLSGAVWLGACWLVIRPRSWLVVVPSVIGAATFTVISLL
ncbi:hypothetical protein [Micromonospora sp. NPDC005173]|uniref:hypothetical protein n=1 Tax=Micromonospora sp. NPDC005173 TaxID=3157165 RepID=UPI0033ABCC69